MISVVERITPSTKHPITPKGAMPSHASRPIPAKTPPKVGTKALQVVSNAVTNSIIGAESGCLVVWLESLSISRGVWDILVLY
ncbi:hypothetical protein H7100_03115 [Candidatus Saccharibacteria bacterium]|nr:hypothetical protein [Candidatus Saccharibacteria bacterium]